jgi:electron transport complex protein RnfB
MSEQLADLFQQAFFMALKIVTDTPIPKAGVGGSVESVEFVEPSTIYLALVVLASLGVIFGIALAIVASRFAVRIDPKVEQVRETLPGANCGACGFAGCMGYAEAVVRNPDVATSLCTAVSSDMVGRIAEITGKQAEQRKPKIARVFCQGGTSAGLRKYMYAGVKDCTAAMLAAGGDKSCDYGCLGYATCMRACPFDAITMSTENLPLINPEKCTACGKCVSVCPKQVIELVEISKAVVICCHSRDKGVDTRKKCKVGCIACGLCVKTCPFNAIKLDNNLARINHDACTVCGLCVRKCPTHAIRDYLAKRPKVFIDPVKCTGSGTCATVCPVNAISGDTRKVHVVDPEKCIGCRICEPHCLVNAIAPHPNVSAEAKRNLPKRKESAAV